MKKKAEGNIITDCQFYGVKYDKEFVTVAQTIADGLVVNAKALQDLAKILKGSEVNIEAMLKLEG